VLAGAVFVEVPGDAEGGERPHLVGIRNRPAENNDRQSPVVQLANRPHQVDAGRVGQPQVEHHQIDAGQVGLDAGEQLRSAFDDDRLVPGVLEGGAKPVADKCRVISDKHGLGGDGGAGH